MDERTDRRIRLALRGDESAWIELQQQHWQRIVRLINGTIDNPADVEELAQETFTRAFKALRRWDSSRGSFKVWLTTIALNCVRDHLRSGQRHPVVALDENVIELAPKYPDTEGIELRLDLLAALKALGLSERIAVILIEVHGLTAAEAGAAVAGLEGKVVPARTMNNRCRRGCKRMRALMAGYGPTDDDPDVAESVEHNTAGD